MSGPEEVGKYAERFGPFDGSIWLDVANQGPLPKVAAAAATLAIQANVAPHRLASDSFTGVPDQLRNLLASVIGVPPDQVFLGNSTSYGLHVLARSIQWRPRDEILVDRDDFPANIFPWLCLQKQGVVVRYVEKKGRDLTPADVQASFSNLTRLFCTSWVNSFSGVRLDAESVGAACRQQGVLFVLNGSQVLGTRPVDLSGLAIDAFVSCGYKWLCGPYGTGFCWVNPGLLNELSNTQAYWLRLGQPPATLPFDISQQIRNASAYDVFCPANFFNFLPWIESVRMLEDIGFPSIWLSNRLLIDEFLQTLDRRKYEVLSSEVANSISSIVVFSHHDHKRNAAILTQLRDARVFVAKRRGYLRISPHLHNTLDDIRRVVTLLNSTPET